MIIEQTEQRVEQMIEKSKKISEEGRVSFDMPESQRDELRKHLVSSGKISHDFYRFSQYLSIAIGQLDDSVSTMRYGFSFEIPNEMYRKASVTMMALGLDFPVRRVLPERYVVLMDGLVDLGNETHNKLVEMKRRMLGGRQNDFL